MAKVLLYLGDGFGNVVHATFAVAAIRAAGNDLTVSVISTVPGAEGMVDHEPVVVGVQDHFGYDEVWASPTLPWLRVGGKCVLPDDVRVPPLSLQEWSETEACMWIARHLGYRGPTPKPALRAPLPTKIAQPYIVIAPGFKNTVDGAWRNKAYKHWRDVAKAFLDNKISTVFVGTQDESEPWMSETGTDLCGKTTLAEMAGVLAGASVVLGVDNGPTAISAAYDVPTVVLWGPTSMLKNRKDGSRVVSLAHPDCPCRPCQFSERMVECQDNRCLSEIPVASVIRAATSLLSAQNTVTADSASSQPVTIPIPADTTQDNPVVVIGCGRSGTNMVLEMLRATGQFNASDPPEDKQVISRPALSRGYLTKVDTHYFTWPELEAFLERMPEARIVWTWRDPRDMALSKIRRGAPVSMGGDCETWAEDSSIDGCVEDIRHAVDIYRQLMGSRFAGRVRMVKGEDVILNTEATARGLAAWFGADYSPDMLRFPDYVRQPQKRSRYKTVDPGEVCKWKRWETAYDGWFEQNRIMMPDVWARLEDVTVLLGYEPALSGAGVDGPIAAQWRAWDKELEDTTLFSLPTSDALAKVVVMEVDEDFVQHTTGYEAERERILSRFVEHPVLASYATNLATGTWLHKSSEKYLLDACMILRHMPDLKGKRILEIGPAFGGLARMLLMTEPEIAAYGIIEHGNMLRLATEFLKDQPRVRILDATTLKPDSDITASDIVIANTCLSETTQAFRAWVAQKVFPLAGSVFVVDGDRRQPDVMQWLVETLHALFAKVQTAAYPARPALGQTVYFASK